MKYNNADILWNRYKCNKNRGEIPRGNGVKLSELARISLLSSRPLSRDPEKSSVPTAIIKIAWIPGRRVLIYLYINNLIQ